MPIELRTGLPGAGKTLGAVEKLIELRGSSPERPVYQIGITDLRDGLAIPMDEAALKDWQSMPAGSIIVVDECQKYMPARRGTSDSPQWIRDLSTHRHLGLDFILISQHPTLIDPYVRRLVDCHIHTVRKFGTHYVERWRWPSCQNEPNGVSIKKQAEQKSVHKYSKEAMGAYKSAELHTVKRHVPKFVIVGAAMLVLIPLLAWGAVKAMDFAKGRAVKATEPAGTGLLSAPGSGVSGGDQGDADRQLRRQDFAKWMRPRVDGLPWSAPAFDHMEVRAVPQLFCMAVDDGRCVCHTEQGTRYAVPVDRCRSMVADGLYNPFIAPQEGRQQERGSGERVTQSQAASAPIAPADVEGERDRATATVYTPPTYGKWDSDPFGASASKK